MISIEKCKSILNDSRNKKLTQKEVEKIRDFLYQLAKIEYDEYSEKQKQKKESDTLH